MDQLYLLSVIVCDTSPDQTVAIGTLGHGPIHYLRRGHIPILVTLTIGKRSIVAAGDVNVRWFNRDNSLRNGHVGKKRRRRKKRVSAYGRLINRFDPL